MISQQELSNIKNKFSKHMSYSDVIEICNGTLDVELAIYIFHNAYHRLPNNKEELNDSFLSAMISAIKKDCQQNLDQYLSRKHHVKTKPNFLLKSLSNKSQLGSIKEISIKFGLSIAYIRELKKDNILEICYEIFNNVDISATSSVFKYNESDVFDLYSLKK